MNKKLTVTDEYKRIKNLIKTEQDNIVVECSADLDLAMYNESI